MFLLTSITETNLPTSRKMTSQPASKLANQAAQQPTSQPTSQPANQLAWHPDDTPWRPKRQEKLQGNPQREQLGCYFGALQAFLKVGSRPPSGLFAVGALFKHRRSRSGLSGHFEESYFLNSHFFKIADSCWSTTPVHKKRASGPLLVATGPLLVASGVLQDYKVPSNAFLVKSS